jgi:excisionase family DNA binding protein
MKLKNPEIPNNLRTVTVVEAADILRTDQATVRDWCRSGRLGHVRWGEKSIRIRLSTLEEFLTENTVKLS